MLYLDRPLWEGESCAGVGGRFGYSDLKEAALSGAAGYGSWMKFSWCGGLVAGVFGVVEQGESATKSRSKGSVGLFGGRAGAAASGQRVFGRRLGGHAVACCGFEAGVACSCGDPVLLWW